MPRKRKIWLLVPSLLIFLLAAWQAPFAWRRFHVYPRTRAALEALEHSRIPPASRSDGLLDLRGVIHSHSWLSHDSTGTPDEIVRAAQAARVDFVVMTDHYGWINDSAVVTKALRGEHGGVLFMVGAEMRDGVMPLFLEHPLARYDPHQSLQAFVDGLRSDGALVFLNHPDDPLRRWDVKGWAGMEIYNFHADVRKSHPSIPYELSEQLWSMQKYPMEVLHQLFQEPRDYLALWDRFTQGRRVIGIAGNDAHQNNGLRLIVSRDGAVVVTDTGKKEPRFLSGYDWLSRSLTRICFGPLTPGRTLWRTDADLYERIFRFVNTHLLAAGKNEQAIRAALENGHAYVAFDSLVTSTGFDFALYPDAGSFSPDASIDRPLTITRHTSRPEAIMGDEVPFQPGRSLVVTTPVPAFIRIVRNGGAADAQFGTRAAFSVAAPGVYRAEALLRVRGQLIPWIYSNPIYIREMIGPDRP
jgi:hypothetical protein